MFYRFICRSGNTVGTAFRKWVYEIYKRKTAGTILAIRIVRNLTISIDLKIKSLTGNLNHSTVYHFPSNSSMWSVSQPKDNFSVSHVKALMSIIAISSIYSATFNFP